MNTTTANLLPRSDAWAAALVVSGILLLPIAGSQALSEPAARDSLYRTSARALSIAVADQGNRALQAIREEARTDLAERLALPPRLSSYAVVEAPTTLASVAGAARPTHLK